MVSILLLVKLSVWAALLDGGPCVSHLALRPALGTQDSTESTWHTSILSRFLRESNGTIRIGKLRQDTFLLQTQRACEQIVTVSLPATVQSQRSVKFGAARFT